MPDYTCPHCGFTATSRQELAEHIRERHGPDEQADVAEHRDPSSSAGRTHDDEVESETPRFEPNGSSESEAGGASEHGGDDTGGPAGSDETTASAGTSEPPDEAAAEREEGTYGTTGTWTPDQPDSDTVPGGTAASAGRGGVHVPGVTGYPETEQQSSVQRSVEGGVTTPGDFDSDAIVSRITHPSTLRSPVTYRCAFCGSEFKSDVTLKRHLLEHRKEQDEGQERRSA